MKRIIICGKVNKNLVLTMFVAIFLVLFISSSYITSAFFISDTYRMRGEITGGGHVNLTNVSAGVIKNVSKIVVGQPIIGNASGGPYKICFGLLCTDILQPYYTMNFSGILKYSNGSAVADSPIKIGITLSKYSSYEFSDMSRTNGTGYFFVKLDNLPDYMMYRNLNISFYVQGDVEAVYRCYYNYSSTANPKSCCKIPLIGSCN